MGKVNTKAIIAITSVMGLLMFLLSEKGDYVYLIDYGSQPLLVKMTYFGLLVTPFLAIVGHLSIWQTGAYLNRLVRTKNMYSLIVSSYIENLVLVLISVGVISIMNQVMVHRFLMMSTFNIFVAYTLYTAFYLLLELLFKSGIAILAICLPLLATVMGSADLKGLGTLVFQNSNALWQPMVTILLTILVIIAIYINMKRKDFYGEG
ncbi:hypothetical protein D0501_07330 [Leuconostoc holzapfelii]|uniref:ABC transporter permease n=1 Tax=Leuconostoc holzapfelii TaxID=434464 RepID=A0ABT2NX13_9LACO|nr:hypothetical protein [Leuconostoc holzapfelii]MCT8389884.1 hypothetical protein [Leuconostoc holzapfelii]